MILTTMCWKSQDFIILVAVLGKIPLLVFLLHNMSSSSEPIWESEFVAMEAICADTAII